MRFQIAGSVLLALGCRGSAAPSVPTTAMAGTEATASAASATAPGVGDSVGLGLEYDHYALLVADVNRSATFYGDILGLKEVHNATEKPHIRWFSLGGPRQLHLIQDAAHAETIKGVHLALTTSRFDTLVSHLKERAVQFESWAGEAQVSNTRRDGIRQVYFQDPDGYWIEINDASSRWH
jgi:lactoylglutathione lyase